MGFEQCSLLDIDGSRAFHDVCFICSCLRYLSILGEPMPATIIGPFLAGIYIDTVTMEETRDLRAGLCIDVGDRGLKSIFWHNRWIACFLSKRPTDALEAKSIVSLCLSPKSCVKRNGTAFFVRSWRYHGTQPRWPRIPTIGRQQFTL
jgi:hypothetical protein